MLWSEDNEKAFRELEKQKFKKEEAHKQLKML